jgi:hypothetical protein
MIGRAVVTASVIALGIAAAACAKSDEGSARTAGDSTPAAASAGSARKSGADRNACDLLTEAEVSAAAGVPVKARETNHETGRSDCGWFGADNIIAMQLVAYWTGGREGWEIMAASRGMAKDLIQKNEGADMDSVVKNGPVSGLGDKAFFSDLLPSLVLKDNVLLEFTLSPLPTPAVAFRPLATKALSRL